MTIQALSSSPLANVPGTPAPPSVPVPPAAPTVASPAQTVLPVARTVSLGTAPSVGGGLPDGYVPIDTTDAATVSPHASTSGNVPAVGAHGTPLGFPPGATASSNGSTTATNGRAATNDDRSAPANDPAVNAAKNAAASSELTAAVQKLNTVANDNVEFTVDPTTQRRVVQIVDPKTKQVVQQIPSKTALAIAASIEKIQGLFVNEQA